jgi:hypothetical protein
VDVCAACGCGVETMLFPAHVKNGVIVPAVPIFLPEGAAVTVVHKEVASVDEQAIREAARIRLDELITEIKEECPPPPPLTEEEIKQKREAIQEIFRDMENDPEIPLAWLDREVLYGD